MCGFLCTHLYAYNLFNSVGNKFKLAFLNQQNIELSFD